MIQSVEFYFDPSCPWCWVTSRWLKEVTDIRGITVAWRPFSLALKNEELVESSHEKTPYAKEHRSAHRVLRLIESAVEKYGENTRFDLYSAIGEAYHVHKKDTLFTDELISDAIAPFNYDLSLETLDDIAYDRDLQGHLDNAISVAGNDTGVPLIIFVHEDETKIGYFGPVITDLPETDESLAMWDGLVKLASVKNFYELKRTRSVDANTLSTQRLL